MKMFFSYIYSFLTDGLLYIVILLPVYILCRLIFIRKAQKNISHRPDITKEIIRAGLFIYLIMLFTQTFIVNSGESTIELIPFRVIINQLKNIEHKNYGLNEFIFNVVGNIGVFVPVGIALSYLLDSNLKKTLFYGCILSLFIEIVQIPLPRVTDIDDVILNTTGAFIGFEIYKIISHKLKQRTAVI